MGPDMHKGFSFGSRAVRGKRRNTSQDRLRQAMARRRLEEIREQKMLQDNINDIFGGD